jgi:hypothetical protein
MNTKNKKVPDRALELMPWFAIGELSSDEQVYFEEALVEFPELQRLLDQERKMIHMVSEDKSLLDLSVLEPTEERLKSVLNQIDSMTSNEEANGRGKLNLFDTLKQALSSWLPSDLNILANARVASAAVLVVTIAVMMAFVAPLFNQEQFTPASAVDPETNNPVSTTMLLVGFNGSSVELGAYPAFRDKLAKIETVPNKKGMYKVSLNQKLSAVEMKELLTTLEAQTELVWFVGEAF